MKALSVIAAGILLVLTGLHPARAAEDGWPLTLTWRITGELNEFNQIYLDENYRDPLSYNHPCEHNNVSKDKVTTEYRFNGSKMLDCEDFAKTDDGDFLARIVAPPNENNEILIELKLASRGWETPYIVIYVTDPEQTDIVLNYDGECPVRTYFCGEYHNRFLFAHEKPISENGVRASMNPALRTFPYHLSRPWAKTDRYQWISGFCGEIPDSVWQKTEFHPEVMSWTLENGCLQEIPPGLNQESGIFEIDLSGNSIRSLPPWLLDKLRTPSNAYGLILELADNPVAQTLGHRYGLEYSFRTWLSTPQK